CSAAVGSCGAQMHSPCPHAHFPPRPVQHGGGVKLVVCPSLHFHASDVRSVAGGPSYPDGSAGTVGRCNGLRVRSLNDPHDAGLRPFNRHTLKPCATPASGANSTHPSPSARPFRLPFKGVSPI